MILPERNIIDSFIRRSRTDHALERMAEHYKKNKRQTKQPPQTEVVGARLSSHYSFCMKYCKLDLLGNYYTRGEHMSGVRLR